MKKNEVDRGVLKYNFLKKIIIRFDYDGMDDAELDQVISDISIELKKHDYVERTLETAERIGILSDDPENAEEELGYGRRSREQKMFVFHNQNPQVKLKISASCACITIEKTRYVNCLTYCHVLGKVMTIISGKVPFFRYTRFGLRKINECFLTDIDQLNEYFEPSHFQIFRFGKDGDVREKVMQLRESFEIAEYNMNLVRTIIRGEIEGQIAYQINYDSDIYLFEEDSIAELVQREEKIKEMNDWLFCIYKDAVTEKFLNQLIDGTFDENIILGVEANGEGTV